MNNPYTSNFAQQQNAMAPQNPLMAPQSQSYQQMLAAALSRPPQSKQSGMENMASMMQMMQQFKGK